MNQTGLTKDLNRSEEVVLVTLALNPDKDGEWVKNKLDTSAQIFSGCVDSLIHKGYIHINENERENYWEITDLGRMALSKFRMILKYDLVFAKKRKEPQEVIQRLQKRKRRFDLAYNKAKERHEQRQTDSNIKSSN